MAISLRWCVEQGLGLLSFVLLEYYARILVAIAVIKYEGSITEVYLNCLFKHETSTKSSPLFHCLVMLALTKPE